MSYDPGTSIKFETKDGIVYSTESQHISVVQESTLYEVGTSFTFKNIAGQIKAIMNPQMVSV